MYFKTYTHLNTQHLENYQRNKLQKPTSKVGSLTSSIDIDDKSSGATPESINRRLLTPKDVDLTQQSRLTTTTPTPNYENPSLGKSDNSLDIDSERLNSSLGNLSTTTKHSKVGQLMKSNSMDIGKQIANTPASTLFNSISVDRLLIRSESMSDRDLRKIFKELVIEYERLKDNVRTKEEVIQQLEQDWIRKERQFQRKVSELEEENKQLEEYKLQIQRLKDENSSLIRVVSKLTKQN